MIGSRCFGICLVLCLFGISLSTAYVCDPDRMLSITNSLLQEQVTHNWAHVFATFDQNIILEANVLAKRSYFHGKPTVEAAFGTIGFIFQAIDAITKGPFCAVHEDYVICDFEKTQRSLLTNIGYNLTFAQKTTFRQGANYSDCILTIIREYATGDKTALVFPVENVESYALLCWYVTNFCTSAGYPIDFGEGGNCYDFWRDAPVYQRSKKNLGVILNSHSLVCISSKLETLNVFTAPLYCPQFGVEQPNMVGCW